MDMPFIDILARVIIGLVIGFNIGLTGIGGGVLALPALTLLLQEDPTAAVGTAAAYSFLTKIFAAWRHTKLKNVDKRSTSLVLAGAIPGTIVVAILMNKLMETKDLGPFINEMLAVAIIFAAVLMLVNFIRRGRGNADDLTRLAKFVTANKERETISMLLVGAFTGAIVASTSMNGVMIVVMMVMVLGMDSRKTVGSSIMVAVVLTFITACIYSAGSHVNWVTASYMAVGSIAGVWMGSNLTVKVPERRLRAVVIAVVFAAGIAMLVKTLQL